MSSGNVETRFRDHNDLHNPNVISEIIRRCHSIPVTIRALLMKYKQIQNSALKHSLNSEPDNSDNNGNNPNGNNNIDKNFNSNNNNNTKNDSFNNFNGGTSDYSVDRGYMTKQSAYHQSLSDEDDQTCGDQEPQSNVTPLSVPGHHNRLTPSRRDSYRTNSSSSSSSCGIKTPNVSTSIFEFSNSISEQKRIDELRFDKKLEEYKKQQQQQPRQDTMKPVVKKVPKMEKTPKLESSSTKSESQFELSCDQEIIDTLKKVDQQSSSKSAKTDERSSSTKSEKNLGFQTPNLPVNTKKSTLKTKTGSMDSPSPSPVSNSNSTTPLVNKKRKAPSNSESSSTPSSVTSSLQVLILD